MEKPTPTPQGGTEPPAPTPDPTPASDGGGESKPGQTPEKGFTQEDIDKAVNEAVKAAQEKWEKDQSEADRLSKLNKEDRKKEQMRLDREKLDKDIADFNRKQLIGKTGDLLAERGLSRDFAERLCGKNAEETKANIDAFEKDFKASVEASVTERLKGNPPKSGGENNEQTDPFLQGFGI